MNSHMFGYTGAKIKAHLGADSRDALTCAAQTPGPRVADPTIPAGLAGPRNLPLISAGHH